MHRSLLLLPLALAACVEEQQPDGRALFLNQCAACHGTSGEGDGPLAGSLGTTPPDLTRIAERNAGVYPRNYVMSIIDGLDRGAHFSAAMPEFGAGDLGPLVMTEEDGNPVPIPADLLALSDYLQTLQR